MTSTEASVVPPGTFVIPDVEPSVRVAFPLQAHAPTFGLDQPTRLLGGAALPPDALSSATGLDHVPGLRSLLADACRAQASAGRDWFSHPPVVLVGAAGLGRGGVARRIADLAGVPLVEVEDAEAAVGGSDSSGMSTRDVPSPVLAMALTRCANPIVLLDLTKHDPSPPASLRLVELLDPSSTGRWLDEGLRTVFDLSNVSWIVQAPRRSPTVMAMEEAGGHVIEVAAHFGVRENLRRLSVADSIVRHGRSDVSPTGSAADVFAELQRRFPNEAPTGRSLWEHAVAFRDRLGAGG